MARFFISYSRADGEDTADNIRRNIAAIDEQHTIFIDKRGIDVSASWPDAIAQNIQACQYFILVLTPASIDSEWVQKEVKIARKSELLTGMKKLYVVQKGDFKLPAFVPASDQVLKLTDNFCVDFYRLVSGIFANQSFFKVRHKVDSKDDYCDVTMWVTATSSTFKKLILSVEYRFDYEFNQSELGFKRVVLKKNAEKDFKITFWTKTTVYIFVVIYLKNSKQVNIVHEVSIGR